jgi:excisionase family DNA binding protein
MSERTLSTREAAAYIGVSKKTLLKYCRDRHITYMRYPGGEFRFRQSALDVFMGRCTVQKAA